MILLPKVREALEFYDSAGRVYARAALAELDAFEARAVTMWALRAMDGAPGVATRCKAEADDLREAYDRVAVVPLEDPK